MEFRFKYDKHDRKISNPGDPIKDDNKPVLDKFGNRVIESAGKIDLYAQIQSWRDECDINILMAKFTNGDKTALMQRVGAYLDLSNIPDNFNDMLNLTTTAQSVFDSLPTDVKKVFGNNVNNFLANSKSKEFEELLSKSPEDLRREKVVGSNKFNEINKEASKPWYANNSALVVDNDNIPVEPVISNPGIIDEVKRSLNESK